MVDAIQLQTAQTSCVNARLLHLIRLDFLPLVAKLQNCKFASRHSLIKTSRRLQTCVHNQKERKEEMSAPYTTPNSGTSLASAGVPTEALVLDTTRRVSSRSRHVPARRGRARRAGSARTVAQAHPPRAAPLRPRWPGLRLQVGDTSRGRTGRARDCL